MLRSLVAVLLGCVSGPPPYVKASPTHDALASFAQQGPQGATAPLSTMTSFEWDAVHVFPTGSRWSGIRDETGLDPSSRRDERYGEPGPLLVFLSGDHVVTAIAVNPPLQLGVDGAARFGVDEAQVLALSKPPAPHALVIERAPAHE